MSSAALQAAPHQPTAVGTHSPGVATSANRQYNSTSSPQSRDPYYTQSSTNASPPSSRRPARRPVDHGAPVNSDSQPNSYYSPAASTSTAHPRAPNSNHASHPAAALSSPLTHPAMAPGDHQRGQPPVVSPRTSSNRAAATTSDRSGSRRAAHQNEPLSSPRTGHGTNQQDRVEQQRANGNTQVNGIDGRSSEEASTARSRRRAQQAAQEQGIPHRSSASREPQPSSSTHVAAVPQPPSALSREPSEVLNRVIISPPEVDLERERERMAEAIPSSPPTQNPSDAMGVISTEPGDDVGRGSRSRQDQAGGSGRREKSTKFGEYYLGNTLGEGEFGKVKMGWKQEGGVQVAVKLIRRDSVGTNPSRLAKIYREIAILREISHPNIVRLHEMVETDRQIGIILEYASGGELFDYILNHRYLKDNAARRLFAQLVSGVGYLHKKGIVHRDLKLENLLLDRNRNIIITDFGFANTFNPDDELGDEVEYNLSNREFVKRMELDKVLSSGYRRGDLMQTSCGSPCYAAPELVVSDSLYTGRKVDVWSCGVILYAMLAGYLPFDDDPANPEGDNINLLYKYIVSTPLTFPEYVTPHARDLLRRILVPDPRKRADLFEVARHSWLSEFSHVVGFITSSTTTSSDVANATVTSEDEHGAPLLARSASVREPSKASKPSPAVGDLSRKHGNVDQEATESRPKPQKDNKRRTVQVEYVAPRSETQRGDPVTAAGQSNSRTRARSGSQGPVEIPVNQQTTRRAAPSEKPLPQNPPVSRDVHAGQPGKPSGSQRQQGMPAPTRPGRDATRAVSDTTYAGVAPGVSIARPNTGGSMTSTGSRSGALPHRGSYSQPAAPRVEGANAHGRMAQPNNTKPYNMPGSMKQDESDYGRPSSTQVPPKFARVTGMSEGPIQSEAKQHKRSNTIGSLFGRTNSIFGGKSGRRGQDPDQPQEKVKKSYPPVSMTGAVGQSDTPRQSMDSRRSISFGFGKKRSGSIAGGSQTTTLHDKPRRFSLLPAAFSRAIGINKDYPSAPPSEQYDSNPDIRSNFIDPHQTSHAADNSRNVSGSTTAPRQPYTSDGSYDRSTPPQERRGTSTGSPSQYKRYTSQPQSSVRDPRSGAPPQFLPPLNFRQGESALATESESSLNDPRYASYPAGFNEYDDRKGPQSSTLPSRSVPPSQRGVLQKNNRKFTDAYEEQSGSGFGLQHARTHTDHAGSSGAARKVMDFFRRRGRARGDEHQ